MSLFKKKNVKKEQGIPEGESDVVGVSVNVEESKSENKDKSLELPELPEEEIPVPVPKKDKGESLPELTAEEHYLKMSIETFKTMYKDVITAQDIVNMTDAEVKEFDLTLKYAIFDQLRLLNEVALK